MREKVANKVLFDQETYDTRLCTEIPKVGGGRASMQRFGSSSTDRPTDRPTAD